MNLSIVIPTYRRERVLVDTIRALQELPHAADEIIVVDQSPGHEAETDAFLSDAMARDAGFRWIRLSEPSITRAMNVGLIGARSRLVLFLDDDIRPDTALVSAHIDAHAHYECTVVAGRVLQPWHQGKPDESSGFASRASAYVDEFMGGNFSVKRDAAVQLGGFDERFVRVAYRFEAEFASRVRARGGRIWFEGSALIHHLKAPAGGTRTFGDHLRTASPSHAVGAYYFLLRARPRGWFTTVLSRPWRSIATRHHLRAPWWILPTFVAELLGILWAVILYARGPAYSSADPRRQ